MTTVSASIGDHVRRWREHRRLSQLALATDAQISQKHLSFIESGRAAPSREMVLLLSDHLDVPLRERNALLMAAGYAPIFNARPLSDPALAPALATIERLLKAHEPYPALSLDRHWNLVSANGAVAPLLSAVDPELMNPPVNVLRLSLHPRGLAPFILNLAEWRSHLLDRLRRQIASSLDPVLGELMSELLAYPGGAHRPGSIGDEIAVPLRLRTERGILSFLSTVTVFGTPHEITLSELSLEAFYPADDATARLLGTR